MNDPLISILRVALPLLYGAVAGVYIGEFALLRASAAVLRLPLSILALITHAVLIALVGLEGNALPLDTVPKGILVGSALLAVMILVLERIQRDRSYGAFLFPVVCAGTVLASVSLYQGDPLPQSMHSYFFIGHVSILFSAYSLFCFAFVVSVMYLLQRRMLSSGRMIPLFRRLPSLEVMDHVVRHADALGLFLLCIGVALGVLWMNDTGVDGRSMGIKIGLSILTAIVYLLEHFLRIGRGWEGSRACMVSIAGFVMVVATLLAGRHGF